MEKIIKSHQLFCTIKIDSRHNGLTLNFAGQRHVVIKRESAFKTRIIYQLTHRVPSRVAGRGARIQRAEQLIINLISIAQIEDVNSGNDK